MNIVKKIGILMLLDDVINYLVVRAEKIYEEAKAGNDKKSFVIAEVEQYLKINGYDKYLFKDGKDELDFEKIGDLIEEKVKEIINKA